MKIYNKFLAVLFAIALVGCSNKDIAPDTDIDIPLDPNQRYIQFDADVSTRGTLIEGSVLEADFMVLGYQYPGTWESESVLAKPNVFDEDIQLVEYLDGIFKYDVPQVWTGNKYSFFGVYPVDHSSIKFFGDDNNAIKQGVPYITYDLISRTSSLGLIDIMTASYIDTGVASSSTVALEFHHRLAAIDVGARNYYEHDLNGEKVPLTIEITELTIILNNLVNKSAKIYLDHTIPSEYTAASVTDRLATYVMVHPNDAYGVLKSKDIIPNTKSYRDMQFITMANGNNASAMIVIPQDDYLVVGGSLKFKKRYVENGESKYLPNPETNDNIFTKELSMTFDKKIQEGRRYFIEFTFTSDAVSINVIAADEWDDKDDIYHQFE